MPTLHSTTQNHLLAAFPSAEYERLAPHLDIDVLDRPGLEQAVCECYGVVQLEVERLLSDIPRVNEFIVVAPLPVPA